MPGTLVCPCDHDRSFAARHGSVYSTSWEKMMVDNRFQDDGRNDTAPTLADCGPGLVLCPCSGSPGADDRMSQCVTPATPTSESDETSSSLRDDDQRGRRRRRRLGSGASCGDFSNRGTLPTTRDNDGATATGLATSPVDLQPGDHVCGIARSEADEISGAVDLLRGALKYNHKVYICDGVVLVVYLDDGMR